MIQYVEDSVRFMHYVDDVPDAVLDSLDLTWLRMTPDDRSAASKLLYQIKLMVDGDDVDHESLVTDLESSGCREALKLVQSIIPMTRTTRASTREVTLTRYQAEGILSRDVRRAKNPLVKGGILSVEGENLIFTSLGMRVYMALRRCGSLSSRNVTVKVRLTGDDAITSNSDGSMQISTTGPGRASFIMDGVVMLDWEVGTGDPVADGANAMCMNPMNRFPIWTILADVPTRWPELAMAVADCTMKRIMDLGPRTGFLVKFAEGVLPSDPDAS